MRTIQPMNDKIVIIRDKSKNEVNDLFVSSKEVKPDTGKVVAVGPGKDNNCMLVNVGDTIIFPQNLGVEVTLDDQTYLVLTQDQLIGIIK